MCFLLVGVHSEEYAQMKEEKNESFLKKIHLITCFKFCKLKLRPIYNW